MSTTPLIVLSVLTVVNATFLLTIFFKNGFTAHRDPKIGAGTIIFTVALYVAMLWWLVANVGWFWGTIGLVTTFAIWTGVRLGQFAVNGKGKYTVYPGWFLLDLLLDVVFISACWVHVSA